MCGGDRCVSERGLIARSWPSCSDDVNYFAPRVRLRLGLGTARALRTALFLAALAVCLRPARTGVLVRARASRCSTAAVLCAAAVAARFFWPAAALSAEAAAGAA